MGSASSKTWVFHPGWSLILAGVPLFLCLHGGPVFCDDAFITFRHAENLVSGKGFVYNSTPILGTTTPLFCFILAFFGKLGVSITDTAFAVNILAVCLTPLLLWQLGRKLPDKRIGLLAGILLCLNPDWWVASKIGMESTLAGFLSVVTYILYLKNRPFLTGLFAGILTLTRPDCATLLAIFFLFFAKKNLKSTLIFCFGFLTILIPWLVYSFSVFGSPFPSSLAAKRVTNSSYFFTSLSLFIRALTFKMPVNVIFSNIPNILAFILRMIITIYVLLGLAFSLKYVEDEFPYILWPFVLIVSLSLTGIRPFIWYITPVFPVLMLAVSIGIIRSLNYYKNSKLLIYFCLAGIILHQIIFSWVAFNEDFKENAVREMFLLEAAKSVKNITSEMGWEESEIKVSASEIGVVGYELLDSFIIDGAGIVSPEVTLLRKNELIEKNLQNPNLRFLLRDKISLEWSKKVLMLHEPDFIISNQSYLELPSLIKDKEFHEQYRIVKTWEHNNEKILLFQKKSNVHMPDSLRR